MLAGVVAILVLQSVLELIYTLTQSLAYTVGSIAHFLHQFNPTVQVLDPVDHADEFFLGQHSYSFVGTDSDVFISHLTALKQGNRLDLRLHTVKGLNLLQVILGLAGMSTH